MLYNLYKLYSLYSLTWPVDKRASEQHSAMASAPGAPRLYGLYSHLWRMKGYL